MTGDTRTCEHGHCAKRADVTIRDGRHLCKRHADRVPRYLRRPERGKAATA